MAASQAQPIAGALEAEPDTYETALGDDDVDFGSDTSISSSILKFREENGRTYHSYKEGKYLFPNDAGENDRLDLQHHLFSLTFDGKLFLSPVAQKPGGIKRVLDIGTGTGIWAIDFADEYPDAQVVGIDLSPIQPRMVPPNIIFQVDDLEEQWGFREGFDFIYSRMMSGGIADWPKLFQQSFENLNPGGYIEVVDYNYPFKVDDDSLPPNSALQKWCQLMLEGCAKAGRSIDSARHFKKQLEEVGFVDVVEQQFKWPQNRWPKDKKYKELGMWTLENAGPQLEGISMAIFTRFHGWTKEDVEAFVVDVRKEMRDTRIHVYWPIYVVYGRKPEAS